MKIRGSQPLRNAPETAKSISVGRFRPVGMCGARVAEFRRPIRTSAKSGQIGAPGRTRTFDPRLRRPVLYPPELRALALMVREPPRRRAPPRQNLKSGRPAAIPGHGIEASITASEMPKKMSAC